MSRFKRLSHAPVTVLDVGCGTGWYLDRLRSACDEAVGIDVSMGMLAVARRRLPGATLLKADARMVPFTSRRFDVALCTRVLSHLSDVESLAAEMGRILAPGGILILSDVDAGHDYEHTRLPVPSGRVAASTYKHPRRRIYEAMETRGFRADSASDIRIDGSVCRSAPSRSGLDVVGWIGVWRKEDSTSASTSG